MGHSANYQTELYIKDLEQAAQILADQGVKLKKNGYESLANASFEQAEKLELVIAELRRQMDK